MNETILLVEDDANDVFFMKRAMKLAGVVNPVQVAADGRQAIQYLDDINQKNDPAALPLPCLVLLDLKLPHVMGLEVLRWIRAQPAMKQLIVVVFTSSQLPPDVIKAYALGANSYLVKPSSSEGLPETVRILKHYWLDLNQGPPSAPGFDGTGHVLPSSLRSRPSPLSEKIAP